MRKKKTHTTDAKKTHNERLLIARLKRTFILRTINVKYINVKYMRAFIKRKTDVKNAH